MSRNDMIRTAVATDGTARCAFDRCQAGGDILDRAPRVVTRGPFTNDHWSRPDAVYHPGCWAAFLNEPPF